VQLGDPGQLRLTLDEALDLAADATVLEVVETAAYAFYHHLLQEYFAAREVLRQYRARQNLSKRWRVPWRKWQFMPKRPGPGERLEPPPVTGWEETFIMASGRALPGRSGAGPGRPSAAGASHARRPAGAPA
jgi:hypothetical protein